MSEFGLKQYMDNTGVDYYLRLPEFLASATVQKSEIIKLRSINLLNGTRYWRIQTAMFALSSLCAGIRHFEPKAGVLIAQIFPGPAFQLGRDAIKGLFMPPALSVYETLETWQYESDDLTHQQLLDLVKKGSDITTQFLSGGPLGSDATEKIEDFAVADLSNVDMSDWKVPPILE